MSALKNLIFIITLIYAGYYDYKNRIILDRVHMIIVISSLLSDFSLFQSFIGFFLLPMPLVIVVLFDENSLGGGDIKLVAAIGFFLGLIRGTIALIIGQFLAVLITIIIKRDKKDTIPMAPYLAIGCFISLLMVKGG